MRRRRGASALETALVLPLLLAVLFGVIDWAWYLFQDAGMVVAARRGTRLVAGLGASEGPEAVATAEVIAWLDAFAVDGTAADVDVVIVPDAGEGTVTITVAVDYDPLVGWVPVPTRVGAVATGPYYGGVYE